MKRFRLLVSGLFLLSALFLHAQEDGENTSCGQVTNVQIVKLEPVFVSFRWDFEWDKYPNADLLVIITNVSGDTVVKDDNVHYAARIFSSSLPEPNTTYNYSISAICSADNIGEPVTGQFSTPSCDIQVSNVRTEPGPTYVDMGWKEPSVNTFYSIHAFITNVLNDTIVQSFYASNPITMDYLNPNNTYKYGIVAKCSQSTSGEPVIGMFTTPLCPPVSNVETNVELDRVQFSWIPGEDRYSVKVLIVSLDGDTVFNRTTEVDRWINHLQVNTTYRYNVRSWCHDSLSEPVTGTFTTPPCSPVSNVEVTAGMTSVYMTWDYPELYGLSHVVVTNVAGDTIIEGEFDDFNAFNEFSSSFQLEPNTTYLYSIVARCIGGGDTDSEPVTGEFTTLPIPQVSNVQVFVGISDVKLTWDAPEAEITGYNVTLSQDKSVDWGAISPSTIVSTDVSDTCFFYYNLKPQTAYLYEIVVKDINGNYGEAVKGAFTTLKKMDNENRDNHLSVQIYPNPNTGEAVIEIDKDVYMEVFSPTGAGVEAKTLTAGKHTVRFSSKGVFMVRLTNNAGTVLKRVVVQ